MNEIIESVMQDLHEALERRNQKYEFKAHHSVHETYGILAEEMKELLDEIHLNHHEGQYREMCDVTISALMGMVSLRKY